jgi:hypothetical protein
MTQRSPLRLPRLRAVSWRELIAAGLAALAAAWPTLFCAVTAAMQSPLERALKTGWCGAGPATASGPLLGHCAWCWTGMAALALAAALTLAGGAVRRLATRRPARN